MEDAVEALTRGNPTEVKVLLTSIALALGGYQLALISVVYGKVRPAFLQGRAAGLVHRASGDAIVVLLLVVGAMCLALHGWDDAHAAPGAALAAVLALKVAVVRRGLGLGRLLPVLGLSVFALLTVTWAMSAGSFLA